MENLGRSAGCAFLYAEAPGSVSPGPEVVTRVRDRPTHPAQARQLQPMPGTRPSTVARGEPHLGHRRNRRNPPFVVAQGSSTTSTSAAQPSASRWTHRVRRHRAGPSSSFRAAVEMRRICCVQRRRREGLTCAPQRGGRWRRWPSRPRGARARSRCGGPRAGGGSGRSRSSGRGRGAPRRWCPCVQRPRRAAR